MTPAVWNEVAVNKINEVDWSKVFMLWYFLDWAYFTGANALFWKISRLTVQIVPTEPILDSNSDPLDRCFILIVF